MKLFERWRMDRSKDGFDGIETQLGRHLVPIVPGQEFVAGLRKNLLSQVPDEVEIAISTQKRNLQNGLVVTGGILGGILLILSGVRGIISLVGMVALLINWYRQYSSQQTPTVS